MIGLARLIPVRTLAAATGWIAEPDPPSACPHPRGPRRCVSDGGASYCRFLAHATRGGAAIQCLAPWSGADLERRLAEQAAEDERQIQLAHARYRAAKRSET